MSNVLILLSVVALSAIPFTLSFHLNGNREQISSEQKINKSSSVSLDQFNLYRRLGSGAFGSIYLAKKIGGSDDGKFYALKAIDITLALKKEATYQRDFLDIEREILEAVTDRFKCITRLHYAFRERSWLYLVMDLGVGGTLSDRINANQPNDAAAKQILVQLISAIEKLHNANIFHGDLVANNIMIDAKGHLLVGDFGISKRSPDNGWQATSKKDWKSISHLCYQIFADLRSHSSGLSVAKMLNNMSDADIPALKSHLYFRDIDWEKVAERESLAPFECSEMQMTSNDPLNKSDLFEFSVKADLDESVVERFRNYLFVAEEHRN